jgi:lipoprotein-anchoring transpeptidase ErfK/SrfK
MPLSRREFLASMAAAVLLPAVAQPAAAEAFPVNAKEAKQVDYKFQMRQIEFETAEPAGTIVVDAKKCFLYLVLGQGQAIRYGVSLGKSAHAWEGEVIIKKMAEWPIWIPAPYHIQHKPELAKWLPGGMPGGPDNPMGARALYLFKGEVDTINRIHGAMKVSDIGKKATAGCIGMLNAHIVDLYARVQVGTRVVMQGKSGFF